MFMNIYKRYLAGSILLVLLFFACFRSSAQVNVITERIKNSLLSQEQDDAEIKRFLTDLREDGSWAEIDYSNTSITNWIPAAHSRRLLLICRAYNKPGSEFYHHVEVKEKIQKIIEFYINTKPESKNWWYNAIGAPINLGPALVLMKPDKGFGIEQKRLEGYADQLINFYSESAKKWPFATTGANKIWLLNSSINKACVMNNEEVLRDNFRSAFDEAKIMSGKDEGIKVDNSFYQHGPQLYCAGYGMSFLSDLTTFGILANGTEYAMTTSQLKILTDAVLDGFRWFCQNKSYDFSSAGREISRQGAVSSLGLKTFASRLIQMGAPRQDELKNVIDFVDGKAPFQNPGTRHFWKSDIMVQHGPDYYFSARVPSSRTNGTERMNNENLKRNWLPWGATNIMTDGDEYRNIYAVWDWARVPGVTSTLEKITGQPVTGGAYLVSKTEFAGGVSDGKFGMAAYDFSWDGVSARKAWFFIPGAIFCLGSGVKGEEDKPVITSVNQCFSSGPVMIDNGKKLQLSGEKELNSGDIRAVYHDKIGYYFPLGGNVALRNMDQTGSWSEINLSQSKEEITGKIFSLWVDHGVKPTEGSYEYIVVPSKDPASFSKWIKKNPLEVVTNSIDIQAVYDKSSGVYGISLYNPGSVLLQKGLFVGADRSCIVLFKKNAKGFSLTVSDPTQKLSELNIIISRKVKGDGVTVKDDNTSDLKITLPSGDEAGKSITNDYLFL